MTVKWSVFMPRFFSFFPFFKLYDITIRLAFFFFIFLSCKSHLLVPLIVWQMIISVLATICPFNLPLADVGGG